MSWIAIIQEIVIGAAGDGTGGLVAGMLAGAGARIKRRFDPPPRQQALQTALQQAVEVTLAEYDDLSSQSSYYLDCLTRYLQEGVVQEELGQLLVPGDIFEADELRAEFVRVTQGYTPEQIPDLHFESFLQRLGNAFYESIKGQAVLQPIMQIERLDALVLGLGQLSAETATIGGDIAQVRDAAHERNQLLVEVRDLLAETSQNSSLNQLLAHYLVKAEGQDESQADLQPRLAEYVKWVAGRCGVLELRGVKREDQQVVQLDLDAAYVPLTAEVSRERQRERHEPREVPLNEVLSLGKRLTVIGGPGSGKTTLLLYLAWTLAYALAKDDAGLAQERLGLDLAGEGLPLPIFIPLSAYARHLRKLATSPELFSAKEKRLDYFVSRYLAENYASFGLPADFFAQLLAEQQPVILLLDGLDEVPDEGERVAVRSAVEQLATRYVDLRIVVTCRSAAHKGRTVLGRGFRTVPVQPLSEGQVDILIAQAYEHIYAHDSQEKKKQTAKLQGSVKRLEQARQNRLGKEAGRLIDTPLMVRLLLIVHYSQRDLPEQRAELYMLVTEALLLPDYNPDVGSAEEIGSYIGGSLNAHLELVQYLAFRMHERGPEQGRWLDKREVIAILQEKSGFAPYAERFVHLTDSRGTVLKEEDGVYSFIHLTFQEFLAARYLATAVWKCDDIVAYLLDGPLLDSWWREVILLLAGFLFAEEPLTRGEEIVQKLAQLEESDALAPDMRFAALEIAGQALLEWPEKRAPVQTELATAARYYFEDSVLMEEATPLRRVALGSMLGRLGDTRPGIGLLPKEGDRPQLPDLHFCYVPPGPFWMSEGDETKGRVYDGLNFGYWLSRYPVTQAQYSSFVTAGGYEVEAFWAEAKREGAWQNGRFKGRYERNVRTGPANVGMPFNVANHPVVGISWYEAIAFCRWLTMQLKSTGKWQLQLPSEPEWEKGARGGLAIPPEPIMASLPELSEPFEPAWRETRNPAPRRQRPWHYSDLNVKLSGQEANFDKKIGSTSPSGSFPRNKSPYGVEAMIGNVWEWTRSQDGPLPYEVTDGRELFGNVTNSSRLRLRGGSWFNSAIFQRCGARDWHYPYLRHLYRGFRVVLSPFADR